MSAEKKKCCKDCKNGKPGMNKSCQAKIVMEQLKQKGEAPQKVTEV